MRKMNLSKPRIEKQEMEIQSAERKEIGKNKGKEDTDEEGFKKIIRKKGRSWTEAQWKPKEKQQQKNNRYEILVEQTEGKENKEEEEGRQTEEHQERKEIEEQLETKTQKQPNQQKGIVIREQSAEEKSEKVEYNNKAIPEKQKRKIIKEGKKVIEEKEEQSEDDEDDMQWLKQRIAIWEAQEKKNQELNSFSSQKGTNAESGQRTKAEEQTQQKGGSSEKEPANNDIRHYTRRKVDNAQVLSKHTTTSECDEILRQQTEIEERKEGEVVNTLNLELNENQKTASNKTKLEQSRRRFRTKSLDQLPLDNETFKEATGIERDNMTTRLALKIKQAKNTKNIKVPNTVNNV